EGMDIKISNTTAQAGDKFLLKPVDNVIGGLNTLVTNAADFAAADSTGGASNNENIKELVKLQDQKLVGGTSTLSDFYASLVNDVGSKASQAQIDSEVQNKLTVSFYEQQQGISGVNTNEESVQMQKMQQFFNANAKVLSTVDELFNVLMRAF
ncbi:MAG: flagellar basal body rod C-terminal domain-containing protein, partial [Morganella morganii]